MLRECAGCDAQDANLLDRSKDNEKFLIQTGWFHCVKVDKDVVERSHPLNALFPDAGSAHLVAATWDGKRLIPIRKAGDRSCQALEAILDVSYEKPSAPSAKGLVRMLSEFDALDQRRQDLATQAATKERREKGQRLELLKGELAKIDAQFEKLFVEERKLRNLGLNDPPGPRKS